MTPTPFASLPDVRVRRADELPMGEEVEKGLLEPADEEHPLVERRSRSLEVAEVGEPPCDGRLLLLGQLAPLRARARERAPAAPGRLGRTADALARVDVQAVCLLFPRLDVEDPASTVAS